MPIYEYQCLKCGSRSEVLQRMDAPAPAGCEACGGELRRLLSAPAFQFKGSGWYITDYARKGSPERNQESSNGRSSAAGDGDGSKAGAQDNGKAPESSAGGSATKAGEAGSGPSPSKAARRPDPGTT